MAATSPRLVKEALKTLIETETSVTVYTATQSLDAIDRDHLVLGDIQGTSDPNTMGGSVLYEYSIDGSALLHMPSKPDAQDKAWQLLGAVADVIAAGWTVSGNTLDADLTEWGIEETVDSNGRGWQQQVEFTIRIRDLN